MMMMVVVMRTINSIQQVYIKILAQQYTCQLLSRKRMCKNETQSRKNTCNSNGKQYSKWGAGTKTPCLVHVRDCQNLFEWSSRFPKDIDVFAQMVSSRNTSSERTGLTGDRKQGGVHVIIIIIIIIIKPDIIIRDNEKGTCMLIDVAISGDRNVIKKEDEKILKYKDLAIEIQRMWNIKTKVIPVIIGATGTISKSFRKYVSNIQGKHEVKELQKTAILGTAHILRKVLLKYSRFNTETNDINTMHSNNRRFATLYSLGT